MAAKPTVSRIVHFMLPNAQVRPAIIVNVQSDTTVDLQVFTNGQADRQAFAERVVTVNARTGADQHGVPAVVHRAGVTLGDEPGQWSWPMKG